MSTPEHVESLGRIRHMLDFASKAVGFTQDKSRADLDANEMLALAIIHLIEMLGEASRNISVEIQKSYPEVPWEQIAGTRNRLAHGYIEVDLDIIWTIVRQDLPPLIKQLKHILKNEAANRPN